MAHPWFQRLVERLRRSDPHAARRRRPISSRPTVEALEDRLAPATFAVTTTADSGAGSLRQAILDANGSAGMDDITFNIGAGGVQTISPTSALPAINGQVVLDGNTQPGFAGTPLIQIDGASAGSFVHGLVINGGASGSTFRGLIITRFNGDGMRIAADNLTIQGNYVGTNAAGDSGMGNGGSGIGNPFGGTNWLVGGDQPGQGNVLSGNGIYGVNLSGSHRLMGNIVGLNPAGTARRPNSAAGGFLSGNITVGGLTPGARNVFSGNNGPGFYISGGGVTVQGNYIGLNAAGTAALANSDDGIHFSSGGNNVIGGPEPGARNVISGNGGNGIAVLTSNNRIQGNYIGTNAAGDAAVGNGTGVGVGRHGAAGNLIGGTTPAERNIISGNGSGVHLGAGPTGTMVHGNYIGLNAAGTAALPNNTGVGIEGQNNFIGGAVPGAGNVISGNNGRGISIDLGGTTGNRILGNWIGTNPAGTAGIPNGASGIFLDSPGTTVGGTAPGEGNVIAFNNGSGIWINSGTGNAIRGNSMFSNGGAGIDLNPTGHQTNDFNDLDTGANNRQNHPYLRTVGVSGGMFTVVGTLHSTPNATFAIDFFASATLDPSGFGEGTMFLGSMPVTTDANGNAIFTVTLPSAGAPGTVITATSTDAAGNTSEFSGALLGNGSLLQLSASGYSVNEGGGSAVVTVARVGGDFSAGVTVNYATSNVTAAAGTDYTATSGTLTFASGQAIATVAIPIIDNAVFENTETFNFNLSNPTGGAVVLGASTASVTIIDNDPFLPGSLQFSASAYSVGESSVSATITVTRTGGTDGSVSVQYATSDGSAVAGQDYTPRSGTLTFPAGQTTASFTISITDDQMTEGDETINLTLSNPTGGATLGTPSTAVLTILANDVMTLRVNSFNIIPSGLRIGFTLPIHKDVINLYDSADANVGPPDVIVTGATVGPVTGSVVFNASGNLMYFLQTGPELPPDTYTVTLRSGSTAFRTPSGDLLDGNGDGMTGDDYVNTITLTPSTQPVIGVPDVMRGPGQTLTIPVRINNGSGVNRINLAVATDPALLQFTGATLGPTVPAGSTLTYSPSPGTATLALTVAGMGSLPAGPSDVIFLTATVPDTAPYTSKRYLQVAVLGINGVPNSGRGDDAVLVTGYLGDTSGNGSYSALDATRALRVAVGLDSGFGAYQQVDPVIIADINGTNSVTSTDATGILREAVGIDQPQIPPLPDTSPMIVQGGPDPLLSIPRKFRGRPGSIITVPVNLDPSQGLESADLALSYDPRQLELVGVRRGSLTRDFDLFAVNLDAEAGTLRVGLGRSAGPISGRGKGSVLLITFRIRADAAPGSALINLRQRVGMTATQLNEGGLDLNPDPSDEAGDVLDGVIAIQPHPQRSSRVRDLMFTGGRTSFTIPSANLVDTFFRTSRRRG